MDSDLQVSAVSGELYVSLLIAASEVLNSLRNWKMEKINTPNSRAANQSDEKIPRLG